MSSKSRPVTALKIELWPIERVLPYPKNAKKHPDEQIERLARVIAHEGWDQPIVVDRAGFIIKGHGRRLAALKLGLEQVPVICRADLSAEEADAARIADNAVVSLAFDTAVLQEELQRIMASGAGITPDDLGLSEKERTLLLEQIDEIASEAVLIDTHVEIERQKDEDRAEVARADERETPLGQAFGFKTLTAAQVRTLQAFLAEAEAATGRKGREAFVAQLETMI